MSLLTSAVVLLRQSLRIVSKQFLSAYLNIFESKFQSVVWSKGNPDTHIFMDGSVKSSNRLQNYFSLVVVTVPFVGWCFFETQTSLEHY